MYKKLLSYILFFICGFAVYAQPYDNEWINYSQPYYKIYVHQDGIYRIPFTTLVNAGITGIDPHKFHLFFRGQEQNVYIRGENDGTFFTNGYIEFYGKHNDGTLDAVIYDKPSSQANPNYSLFNDSSAYFLTWDSSNSIHRMISENDVNFTSYFPDTWFYKTVRQDYTTNYLIGNYYSDGTLNEPGYTAGEGWFDEAFSDGSSPAPKSFSLLNKYTSGTNADIDMVVVGASNDLNTPVDHHLKIQFNTTQTLVDTTYPGCAVCHFHRSVPLSQISISNSFAFTSVSLGTANRSAVSYIQVRYPHYTNLENSTTFDFWLPDNPTQSKSYLNLNGFNVVTGDTVRLYDLTNRKRILALFDGSYVRALVPNSGALKECYITSDARIRMISTLIPVGQNAHFTDYKTLANNINADYYILTHNSLMQEALNYRDYRNLPNGTYHTAYSSLVIDVDDLWDQYSYGVMKDPLAIRNFMHSAFNTYTTKPKFLFIIGKGYRAGDLSYPSYRQSNYYWNLTLVPTFGNPPSDILFTTGILDSLYQPAVPTGRLAARNPAHVSLYLNKVQDYELAQQTPQEWMKYVLHFGGGSIGADQAQFQGYLNSYKKIIEDTLFGGWVRSFWKTSTQPIQTNNSDSLTYIINNGVSIMTFFGHAAGSIGFDEGIDNPDQYNNYKKYPFLIANSCFVGDIFLDTPVNSEAFVLIQDKGTIGYLATVDLGVPTTLNMYTDTLYTNIGYRNYGKPIGQIIQNTIKRVETSQGIYVKETCLEMTLHGDPAIVINSSAKPDYMVNPSNVYFTPTNVTNEIDTFYVNVISTNLGRAVKDSFVVRLLRTMPDGITTRTYYKNVRATLFKDTISFKLPVDLINGIGLNKFDIKLDWFDHMDELSKSNNTTEVTLLIQSSDIVPVWPYKYAVVRGLPLYLKASTSYAFLPSHKYVFELDTTDSYNSPVKQHYTTSHSGGVVSWSPSYPIKKDSIVYFWRVSIDSAGIGHYNWRESSFQYITGQRGWGQAHFDQFKNDSYQFVSYNKPARKFEFANNVYSVVCQTGVYPNSSLWDEWYSWNGQSMYIWAFMGTYAWGNGMILADFDPISGQPRQNPSTGQPAFEFSTVDTASMNALAAFITAIPVNHWVLAYSHRNDYVQNWTLNLKHAFQSLGGSAFNYIANNTPYILFCQKGNSATTREVSGPNSTSIIHLVDSIPTKWTQGYVESELIGPASKWGSLHWREHSLEGANTDIVSLSVLGFNNTGGIDTLINKLPPDSGDINNLSSRINAHNYPTLKLIIFMKDDSLHTAAQMRRWQVLYEGVPETALNPSKFYHFYKDTLAEGDILRFGTATENISTYNMDSLLIKYWIVDKNRNIIPLGTFRRRPHPAGDVLIDSIHKSTVGLSGLNSLWIEVNPNNDQPEQYHFNNLGEVYFYVNSDRINPILDVTFDGEHIMDGDIVSAKPEIQIMLKDENKFLLLNTISDTSRFKIWIVPPGTTNPQRIYFYSGGQEILKFIPASLPENKARILYHPVFSQDGIYQLMVEAKDKSNNESGDNNYKISFEVINKSTITAVMNWPNPFSTATHFVFTLTGSEVPTFFMIQIMTITGKVVKEISLDELGPIHIGRNITDYAWNGTDNFGDRLANGIYLYRVITRIGNTSIDKSATQADQYFTKDFGKMYLIH